MALWIVIGSLAALAGLVFAILTLVVVLGGGKRKGWKALAAVYPVPLELGAIEVWPQQTVQIGAVRYRKCVQVGILSQGLYLDTRYFGLPAMLIPWEALAGPVPQKLYGLSGSAFGLRDAVETQLVVYDALGQQIATHVPSRRWGNRQY